MLTYTLVGYNSNDRVETEYAIPQANLQEVKELVNPGADDPDMIYSYSLSKAEGNAICSILQKSYDDNAEYFVECHA